MLSPHPPQGDEDSVVRRALQYKDTAVLADRQDDMVTVIVRRFLTYCTTGSMGGLLVHMGRMPLHLSYCNPDM